MNNRRSLNSAFTYEKHVAWLEISVNNVLLMTVLHCKYHLYKPVHTMNVPLARITMRAMYTCIPSTDLCLVEARAALVRLCDTLGKVAAFTVGQHQAHHLMVVVQKHLIHLDNARVLEVSQQMNLQ
jgi:hypothetical protein